MGSAEFKQYLKSHTKDFISFKIDLYADDAAQDPIKKAEAIREIITSISLIPDPIKRSVYIQETGHLLKISESVLLSELNKIVIQERKKKPDTSRQEQLQVSEIPEEISSVFKLDTKRMEELQEREVIRLLINYADSELEEDIDLVSYFISEFEDLEFTNTSYATIYDEFYQAKSKGDLIDSNYFLSTGSVDVKRLIAELTTRKHYVSPHWKEKYHIVFSDEKEKIQEHAHQNVLRRKYRYVQRLIEENKEKLKDAEKNKSTEEIDELVETQTRLKMADVEIAKQLGIVSGKY
jgi:DNA primase